MAELSEKDARTWGMLCHLGALAGLVGIPFGNIVGPLVVWLIKRNESAFVDDQGKESLNFQISVTIYTLPLMVLGIILTIVFCIGIILIIAAAGIGIAALVFTILAAVKASNGEAYRYPCTIRFFH
jgi:uncharacterized Tic20 family protein